MSQLKKAIEAAQNNDGSKLILIIGKPGSGKSKIIHEFSNETGIGILNLDQIFKDNSSKIESVMNDFLKTYDREILLIDNKRVLYAKDSKIDMLAFLKQLSQNVIVVATWNGMIEDNKLIHIRSKLPENLEYPLENENITFISAD